MSRSKAKIKREFVEINDTNDFIDLDELVDESTSIGLTDMLTNQELIEEFREFTLKRRV